MSASNWGFFWGDSFWGEEQLSAKSRLLAFVRNDNLSGLVNCFADRTEDLLDVASDCAASVDLDTATGVHLDRIGELLQLPRYGYADERYRVLLQIQAQLILSSTTTTAVILQIVYLFTGHAPTMYSEGYPMGFSVGAQLDDPEDSTLLLELLNKAKAAAYEVTLVVSDTDDFLIVDYSADPLDLDSEDIVDYSTAPITGAGTVSYSFTT